MSLKTFAILKHNFLTKNLYSGLCLIIATGLFLSLWTFYGKHYNSFMFLNSILSKTVILYSSWKIWLFLAKKDKFDGVLWKSELHSARIFDFWAFWFYLILGLKNLNLDLYLPDNTKNWSNYWIFQYKINKTKETLFSAIPNFGFFMIL